jgi:hypothetical protein
LSKNGVVAHAQTHRARLCSTRGKIDEQDAMQCCKRGTQMFVEASGSAARNADVTKE